MIFYVGLVMFAIGAFGVGWLHGLGDEMAKKVALWKVIPITVLLFLGVSLLLISSLSINQGEPATIFKVGNEYTVLDSYIFGDNAYLVLDDGSGIPRWYQVARNKVPEIDLYGRFCLVDTPTGQKFQFFH
ncbi:MAG: hypothetical protein WC386_01660 [Candidatus Paceibacterota bacterium]|jgi:hypothetical protein